MKLPRWATRSAPGLALAPAQKPRRGSKRRINWKPKKLAKAVLPQRPQPRVLPSLADVEAWLRTHRTSKATPAAPSVSQPIPTADKETSGTDG